MNFHDKSQTEYNIKRNFNDEIGNVSLDYSFQISNYGKVR